MKLTDPNALDPWLESLPKENGIYRAGQSAPISYPAAGSNACFQIEDDSFWFNHRNKCISALVEKHSRPGDSFLDLGGGNGFVSAAVQNSGRRVVMMEPYLLGYEDHFPRQSEVEDKTHRRCKLKRVPDYS